MLANTIKLSDVLLSYFLWIGSLESGYLTLISVVPVRSLLTC